MIVFSLALLVLVLTYWYPKGKVIALILFGLSIGFGVFSIQDHTVLADARQLKIHSVEQNLEKAQTELELAQKLEADLLEREKQGAGPELSLHLVHAQGHVMNATTIGYLTKEIINIHTERVNKQF